VAAVVQHNPSSVENQCHVTKDVKHVYIPQEEG
jgi:hypothetical protein